ncbi:MAG: D-2-hydroxyacid dehydrogenase [Victivallales bacterium]|jgi:phosphoglycerate dehydrogenase-like enzyme
MIKILIDMEMNESAVRKLRGIPDVETAFIEPDENKARTLPPELIKDRNVLFCTLPPVNVSAMSNLKLLQIASSGYSQLYNLGLTERGVKCCNARGVFDVPIAEWNIAMMINLVRDLRGMIRNQNQGTWDRDARFQREIRGSVVGLWGYGGIGRETARQAKAMGMVVHVMSRSGVKALENIYVVEGTGDIAGVLPDKVFSADRQKEFLSGLDFLILSIPLGKRTEGIVGEEELKSLPRTAYVLNPARGPLIKEEALLKALREGWIAGAALDTHYHYPMPPDHPLWNFPNVIMTPHISGSSLSTHFNERVCDIFIQNVKRMQSGEPLLNELTPLQLNGN